MHKGHGEENKKQGKQHPEEIFEKRVSQGHQFEAEDDVCWRRMDGEREREGRRGEREWWGGGGVKRWGQGPTGQYVHIPCPIFSIK